MGTASNDTFKGSHVVDGHQVRVEYLDRDAVKRLNANLRRSDPENLRTGWYWKFEDESLTLNAVWHGPYSASGNALSGSFLQIRTKPPRHGRRPDVDA